MAITYSSQENDTQFVYALDKLMEETRRLAKHYLETTGQVLPVTPELARYDCARLISGLIKPRKPIKGVDFVGTSDSEWPGKLIQVKGRVLFLGQGKGNSRTGSRIGQLGSGEWDYVMLVLMDNEYIPQAIYNADRALLDAELNRGTQNASRQKRGALSVSKFKAIGKLLWHQD